MPSLTRLDVRNNMLAALPPTLGQATNLLELKAGFNRLKQLPDSFGMLVNLKTLDVRNNLIQVWQDFAPGQLADVAAVMVCSRHSGHKVRSVPLVYTVLGCCLSALEARRSFTCCCSSLT